MHLLERLVKVPLGIGSPPYPGQNPNGIDVNARRRPIALRVLACHCLGELGSAVLMYCVMPLLDAGPRPRSRSLGVPRLRRPVHGPVPYLPRGTLLDAATFRR